MIVIVLTYVERGIDFNNFIKQEAEVLLILAILYI